VAWSFLYTKYYDFVISLSEAVLDEEQFELEVEDILQRYWIHTVELDSTIIHTGLVSFSEWLAQDFKIWWNIFSSENSEIIRQREEMNHLMEVC
jgi:hypothetical protein